MPLVPEPPRVPLPDEEPVPSTPDRWGLSAGDLSVGEYKNLDEVKYRKWTPLKHLHPGPLGFNPPEEDEDD